MRQSKGVTRRDLLLFFFEKVVCPKAAIEDEVTTTVLGPQANLLINFRKRFYHAQ